VKTNPFLNLLFILPILWIVFSLFRSCLGTGGLRCDLTAKPDWKVYESPKFGLSLESPFEVKWDIHVRKRTGEEGISSLFGITPVNLSGFLLTATAKPSNADSQALLEGFLKSLTDSGFRQVATKTRAVTCSGLPATLVTGSYFMGSDPRDFHYLQVVKGGKAWTVDASRKTSDQDIPSLKRIMDSVKVDPSAP
jgi:hypothetical protein